MTILLKLAVHRSYASLSNAAALLFSSGRMEPSSEHHSAISPKLIHSQAFRCRSSNRLIRVMRLCRVHTHHRLHRPERLARGKPDGDGELCPATVGRPAPRLQLL